MALNLDEPSARNDPSLTTWDETIESVDGFAEFERAGSPGEVHRIIGFELTSVEQDPWLTRWCGVLFDFPGAVIPNELLVLPTNRTGESGWCVPSKYDPEKYVTIYGFNRQNKGHPGDVGQPVGVTVAATSPGPEFTLRVCGWTG